VNNKVVPAWYDVKSLPCTDPERYTVPHVYESVKEICEFICEEATTFYEGDFSKILLSGFS